MIEEIVNKQIEAYKKLDVAGMLQFFHPDIEMFVLPECTLTDAGLEQVKNKYMRFFQGSPNLKFELINRITSGCYVVDNEILHGFLNKTEPVRALVIYQIQDSFIRRVWIGL